MMTPDLVIEAKSLTKRYPGGKVAVDRLDLGIGRGEIFGLLGPNGAGKTTTILMLLGLTDVSEGTVRVAGFDPAREPLAVKRRVGYLPDAVGFYDGMTAFENLAYSARLMGLDRKDSRERIAAALTRVRLSGSADARVATFSRGMRQRLGLADILLKRPEVAILDEPTSALDPQSTHELLQMIREMKADGMTILLSSHLLDRVQSVCDRVALFNRGRIALIGSVPELARSVLGGGYAIEIEAAGEGVVETLSSIQGVRRVTREGGHLYRAECDVDCRSAAAAALVGRGVSLLRLAVREPSLDAIYTHYFEGAKDDKAAA
ncbi:MAG: ABC transporter ATP-binding protein [Alphaproteobacteria bacterium]|nr:ABC transporter ATP-binding protein [Alphaproteobacteria bacterium]